LATSLTIQIALLGEGVAVKKQLAAGLLSDRSNEC